MGLLTLPKGYHPDFRDKNKKPVKFKLDESHQRVGDIAACFLFDGSVNIDTVDLKNKLVGTNENASLITEKYDNKGKFTNFNNATGAGTRYGFDLGTPDELKISDEITIISGMRPRSAQTANWGRIYSQTNGSSSDQVGVLVEDGDNTIHFRINTTSLDGNTPLTAEQYYNVACRYKSGDKSVWINGVQTATASQTGSITTTGNIKLGNHGSATNRALRGDLYYVYIFNKFLSDAEIIDFHKDPYQILKPIMPVSYFTLGAAVAAVTGTATASINEDDITTGGKTVIITLTGDTFKAAGTGPIGSTADTQALIDGFDAASSPANGWNNEVRDKALTSEVVRTSSTEATWTIAAQAGYDIASTETITVTIPTDVLVTGAGAITAVPTFTVDAVVVGGGPKGPFTHPLYGPFRGPIS